MFRSLSAMLLTLGALAAAEVTVAVEQMTFPVTTKPKRAESHYPERKSPGVTEEVAITVVKLANGIVEAWITPELDGRLIRARDLATKVDYFQWTGDFLDHSPW